MEFAFTNSVFSFIVAFAAAILGITSPLLIDNISKIDDKYRASIITTYFQKECVYRLYQKLLLPTISIVFIIPFLLLVVKNACCIIVVLVTQCILLLGLVTTLLYLLHVILTYLNPIKLAKRLFPNDNPDKIKNLKSQDLLNIAVALMKFASEKENKEVYEYCRTFISLVAMSQIPKVATTEQPYKLEDLKECSYNQELIDALVKLTDYSRNKDLLPLSADNILAELMFLVFRHCYFTEKQYGAIWKALCDMSQTQNIEWLRQYWVQAYQYYSFEIELNPQIYLHTEKGQAIKDRFLEFHFMVGALSLFSKNYYWLNFILSYDNSTWQNYYLMPNSFQDIFDRIERIESYVNFKQMTYKPMELTRRYQMNGIFHNIKSDEVIVMWGYRYAAILLIRMCSKNADTPDIPKTNSILIQKLEDSVEYAEKLKNEINGFVKELIDSKCVEFPSLCIDNASSLIEKYIAKLRADINYTKNHPTINIDKIKCIKNELLELDEDFILDTLKPSENDKASMKKICKPVTIDHDMDCVICANRYNYGSSNLSSALSDFLRAKVKNMSIEIPRCNVISEFVILDRNLFKAFAKFNLKNDYTIVVYGIRLNIVDEGWNKERLLSSEDNGEFYYQDCKVVHKESISSVVYIIKNSDMPKIECVSVENCKAFTEREMTEIAGSNNHLYSNLDSLINKHKDNKNINDKKIPISVGYYVNQYIKEEVNAVRIKVIFSGDDAESLDNIKPISSYFNDK